MARVAFFRFLGIFEGPIVLHTHSHDYTVQNLSRRWEWVDSGKCSLCWPGQSWWFDFSLREGNCLKTIGITSSFFIWIPIFLRDRASSSCQCRGGRVALFPIKTLSLRAVKSDLQASAYDPSVPWITGGGDDLAFCQKTFAFLVTSQELPHMHLLPFSLGGVLPTFRNELM